ncbi:palmitoyltransferase ZDHHC15B-like [Liolophura sinensis]|uniref:palmitoyltransferase ZDHHC15B-like n=1 Tax=Liolophura sinensis TaxID=3198878 RepID=UPI003158435B
MDELRKDEKERDKVSARSRLYFCLMAVTLLYSSIVYLIPHGMKDWGEWGVYHMKVLACFIAFNCVANFLCLICYDTSIKKIKDRPGLPRHLWEKPPDRFIPYLYNHSQNSRGVVMQNGSTVDQKYERNHMDCKDGLPWSYCDICDIDLPPRAVHCSTCKKCILKRDHHCYLTGVCVGHYNQRYFAMLGFYTMVSCVWGFCLTRVYLIANAWDVFSWIDFFPPYSLYRVLSGSLEFHIFIMIHHLWILFLFGFAGFMYFTCQIILIVLNKTLYEFTKKDRYRSTTSVARNFRSVFGDFWLINFIFPAQIIFRQSDDGYHWVGLKMKQSEHIL